MKELNEQDEKNKLLDERQKLSIQRNEQDKILKQQNDEQKKLLEELQKISRRKRRKKYTSRYKV